MFGKIIEVHEYNIKIENLTHRVESALVGVHIVFESKYKIVGEIIKITADYVECILVGEFSERGFQTGMTHKPLYDSIIRIVNRDEVACLVGAQEIDTPGSLYIGKSSTYDGFNISANMDSFFSNHYAILGNTGSGKSCTVARLFQNLFYRKKYIPVNAKFALFDVYGEYHVALNRINQTKYCRCKALTTDVSSMNEIVKIPPYYLEVDDIALLLNCDSPAQIPLIEKALKYVYLFTEDEENVKAHKNNIIAKAVMDILTSGKEPARIRDQIFAVLTTFHTRSISLDCEIIQPGYTRTLRQCLRIDESGKINAIQLVTEYIEKFIDNELKLTKDMVPKKYHLRDLYYAFEFALISEGVLKSDKVYDLNNILKVRLDNIINGEYGKYFDVEEYISKEEYMKKLFLSDREEPVQIVNFNLNYVDERFAKTLTKIYAKLFLDYAISLKDNSKFSIQVVLEEAHRYVQNDSDIEVLGYNIFDRITKEGRKYGVLLGLITQRPSELSNTALSQCSNFITLRMFHPDDINIVKNITHSVSENDVEKLKSLSPGHALCFGSAFRIPLFAKIDRPDPTPTSTNVQVANQWFEEASQVQATRVVVQQTEAQKNTIEVFQ